MTERNRDGRPAKGRRLIIGAACLGLLMLAAVCFVCLDTNTTSADPDSGTCGENLEWTFDGDHTLTISGTGEMADYDCDPPWYQYHASITAVVIEEGVTSIGKSAFYYTDNLSTITLPSTLVSIGPAAFEYSYLPSIVVPDGVTLIDDYAFSGSRLESITIGTGLETLGKKALDTTYLTTITVDANNDHFSATNNVLYGNEGKTLYRYAPSKVDTIFSVPDTVLTIAEAAFENNNHLETLNIPASVTSIGYSYMTGLTSYVVSGDNESYSSSAGVLYSKDGSVLISFPTGVDSDFIVPESVVTIADNAFYGTNVETVTLGSHVASVGDYAFEYSEINGITFNETLTTIGGYAFCNCRNLSSLVLPESLSTMGERAFAYAGLTTATINGDGNLVVASYAFSNCNQLATVTIGSGVKAVGERAFAYNDITTLTFEEGIETIGSYAFAYIDITALDLPDSLRVLGDNAFFSCDGLTEVVIPDGLTTVNERAFESCDGIETVTIGSGLTTIGSYAFAGCPMLSAVNYNAVDCQNLHRAFYSGNEEGSADITLTIGANVKTIPSYFFTETTRLKTLTIPGTVDAINDYAFYICGGITTVALPEGLKTIGASAFDRCGNITSVTIPSTVTFIGGNAFKDCTKISTVTYKPAVCECDGPVFYTDEDSRDDGMEVVFGNGVTMIPDHLFANSYLDSALAIPEGVTSIGTSAFYSCYLLTTVTIPSTVSSLEYHAFYKCNDLTTINFNAANCDDVESNSEIFRKTGETPTSCSVVFGEDVRHIPAYLLYGCTHVTSITIPNGVESIGEWALSRTNVTELTIPRSVTEIENYAIKQCISLATLNFNADACMNPDSYPIVSPGADSVPLAVIFGNNVVSVPAYMLSCYDKSLSVTLGSKVETIGEHAFEYCTTLTSIGFPGTLTSIGDSAFYGCTSLQSVVIPQSITGLGQWVFYNCTGLQELTIPGSVVSIGNGAFSNIPLYNSDGTVWLSQDAEHLSGHIFKKVDDKLLMCRYGFTFVVNGGDAKPDYYGIPGEAAAVSDPVRDHYTFAGWYSDAGLQTPYSITVVPDSDEPVTPVTLYAKWTPVSYTVAFNTNGGTPAIDSATVVYLETVPEPIVQMSRTGYTFMYWSLEENEFDFDTQIIGDITLVAEWSTVAYSVTYNLYEGTNGINPDGFTIESEDIEFDDPTKTGYTFGGWFGNAQFEGDAVTGVPAGSHADVTVFAKWTIITYEITYNLNGGTNAQSNPANFNIESEAISFADPSRAGYTFGGWFGNAQFEGDAITGIPAGSHADVTVFAKWTIITYDITYNLNGGTNAPGNPSTYTHETDTIVLGAATKDYWTFDGWYGDSLFTGDPVIQIATHSIGDRELFAKWSLTQYAINYHLDGGVNGDNPATYTHASDTVVLKDATKAGYTFAGWYGDSLFSGDQVTQIASGSSGVKDLYARFTPNQYSIVITGGTSNGSATIRTGDTALSDVVRPGNYGYNLSAVFDSEDLQILDKNMSLLPNKASYTDAERHWIYTGDDTITLHATWTPVWAMMILYGGDVQGTAKVTYMSSEVTYTPAQKTGYTLLGYTYNDTIMLTADGHLVPNFTGFTDSEGRWIVSGGTSLASTWSPNEYAITLDKNGGTANGSATATFDSATLKDFVTVSRTGYELTGFFTEEEGGIKVINADGTLVASAENHTGEGGIWAKTSETTLYAQWQAKTYTITLDKNGGTANGTATVAYGGALTSRTDATWAGLSVTGYFLNDNGTGKLIEADGTLDYSVEGYTDAHGKWIHDGDVRLYAGWIANTYTVTYNVNGGNDLISSTQDITFGGGYTLSKPIHPTLNFAGWTDPQGNIVALSGNWGIPNDVTLTAQWSETPTYEVRFTSEGAGSEGQPFSRYIASGTTIQLPDGAETFTRAGYDFAGWTDFTNLYEAGANYIVTGNVTFDAEWVVKSYLVIYLLDGNSLGGDYQAVNHEYASTVGVLPAFVREGYDVTAWTTQDVAVSDGFFTMPAGQVVFNATSTARTYALTLDKNEGTADGSATATYDSSAVASFVTVARTGYTLNGFFTAATDGIKVMNADGTLVSGAEGYTDAEGNWIKAESVKLFAQWTVNTYSVTIYGQGGTPDTKSIVLTYGSSEISGYQAITRDGYDLKGYYNSDDEDTGVKIIDSSGQLVKNLPQYTDADGKWICTRNISLYAYWDVKTYDINIDNAGGQGSAKFTIVFGTSTVVGYAAPTMTGYTFAGYFTAATDGVKVIDVDGTLVNATGYVTDGKWSKASDTDLFAQWQANTYGMSLDRNGGAINGHVTATYGSSALTNLEDATRYGYVVTGYYTAAEGGVAIIVDGKLQKDTAYTDADGNWNVDDYAILYAHWEPNQYIVTLNSNNGYSDGEAKIAFGTKEFLWFTHASGNTGYHIDGYFTQADGGQLVISVAQLLQSNVDGFTDGDGNWALADNATLYAHWSPNVDGIDLNSNLGDHDGHASVKYDATAPYLITHATRTGYSVEGYYTTVEFLVKVMNADGSFVPNAEGFTDNLGRWHAQGDQMLYARWIPNTYTVTFVNAEGNAVESMQVTYGAAYQLPVPVHNQPEDHFFETWKDSGTQMPISGTWTIAGDVELTAYWSDVAYYDVTYTGGEGGTGEGPLPARVRDGDSITLPAVTFTRTGYDPMGWKEKNGELIREAGASYTVHGDVEFVAMWVIKEYQVQYFIGAGMVYSLTETHNYGDEVTVASYSKPGYDLTPWASEEVTPVDGKFSMPDCYVYFRCTETIHNYQLTLDRNGGTSDGSANITYMQSVGGSLVSPVWEGHHITGYYSAAEGGVLVMQPSCALAQSAEGYTNEESRWIRTEDATLYAHWELDDCQILVDYVFSYGGTAAPALDKTVKYGTQYSERSPDIVGHTPDVAAVEGTAGLLNVHVTVTYSPNQYTISFDSQGGTPVADITAYYGSAIAAPADPTREGFAFGGWLRGSSPYLIPVTMPAENVNLTAQWVKVETSGSSVKVSADSETVVIGMDVAPIASAVNDASTTEVSVAGNGWTMDIPKEIISGATGPVSAGAKTLSENDVASLPAEVQSLLQGKAVFSLSLTDSNGAISFTGKAIKVSLPYKLQDGEKASNVKVFYIDANNQAVEVDAEYDEQTQCAVFSTDHFSTWYVDATASDSGSGGGSNVGLIVGIVVGILVVVAVVAVVVLVKTGKIGGAKGAA